MPAPMSETPETIQCPHCAAEYPAKGVPQGARVRCAKCGATFGIKGSATPPSSAAPTDKLVGRTIGGYQIIEQIARGGMGAVYKAKQLALGRVVALKRLSTKLTDEQFITRFLREARAAAKLSHPNIVQVYDVGNDQGCHFIAMEFVQGRSLETQIKAEGALHPREAVEIAVDVSKALACARESNIVHRDIKPDNVLISEDAQVKVADFGLAKVIDDPMLDGATQEGLGLGTPHYMAPEQASNAKHADHRADIYSLGATLYHMLVARPPFIGLSAYQIVRQHETAEAVSPSEYNPDIPASLCDVIAKMMAKVPEDRYPEPQDLIQGLRNVLGELKVAEAQPNGQKDA